MSYQAIIHANQRRAILTLLTYDSDYRLSDVSLHTGLNATGEAMSMDSLTTQVDWLAEQGFVTTENGIAFTLVTLTNRGLDVAKGITRAPGIRDLLPSELSKLK